jgi:hypothetical protein
VATSHTSGNNDSERWVVPTLLPEGLIVLAGKQQTGKSWLGLSIGLAVARGETLFDEIGVEQGKVLYLALEESEHHIQERLARLRAWNDSHRQDFEYMTSWSRMDYNGLADIESWLVTRPKARLVVIDAWSLVQPAREDHPEGAALDAELEAFERLRKLAHTYRVCILVHYHIDQAISDRLFDELAASSSVNASADGILHLKGVRENGNAALSAVGRAYAQPLDLALSFDDGCWKIAGHAAVRTRAPLSKARQDILDVLHENGCPMPSKEIASALAKQHEAIRRMLHKMKAGGFIEETAQGYRALVPAQELAGIRDDAGHSRERKHEGNDLERERPQNITLLRPVPEAKRAAKVSIS